MKQGLPVKKINKEMIENYLFGLFSFVFWVIYALHLKGEET